MSLVVLVLLIIVVAGLLLYALTHHRQETTMPETPGRLRPTWPELTEPSPEQWLDWVLACGREQQLEIAERVRHYSSVAARCVLGDHETLQRQVDALAGQARDAAAEYRRGWSDGLANLLDRVDAEFDAKYPKDADR